MTICTPSGFGLAHGLGSKVSVSVSVSWWLISSTSYRTVCSLVEGPKKYLPHCSTPAP